MEATEQAAVKNGKGKGDSPSANPDKPRRQRRMRSLSGMAAASDMKDVAFNRKVDTVQTEWKNVPTFSSFSLSADGSFPCVKSSVSSYIDLTREKQFGDIFAGQCYRLY
jgi:hypothetical protein